MDPEPRAHVFHAERIGRSVTTSSLLLAVLAISGLPLSRDAAGRPAEPVAAGPAAYATTQHSTGGGVLQTVNVRIILERSYAMVAATYRIERSGDTLIFNAIRLPGQDLSVELALGPTFDLEQFQRVELHQLVSPQGDSGTSNIRIRYRLDGDVSRIPVFIPNTEIPSGATRIRFTIVGLSKGAALEDAFPDFHAEEDGSVVAMPSELPSAILLPAAREKLPQQNIAVYVAALLAAGIVVYWSARVMRQRRKRHRST